MTLAPGETTTSIAVTADRKPTAPNLEYERAAEHLDNRQHRWEIETDRLIRSRPGADTVLERSKTDRLSLTMETEYGPVLTAGTPWFATVFGRDSLIAAYQTLPMTTEPAMATLRYLADHQATEVDDYRAAAPGKIFHELRHGKLAVRGDVPHSPYYGTIDATALFIILLHETWQQTGDDALLDDLWPHLEAALDWLETFLIHPTVL